MTIVVTLGDIISIAVLAVCAVIFLGALIFYKIKERKWISDTQSMPSRRERR